MANFVGPVGPTDAKIVIVGEAPGAQENRQLRPFVGSSGQLLDRMLATNGIPRSTCYITNVFKKQPAGNDIERYIDLNGRRATLKPGTQEALDDFYEEIAQLNPNVIFALGNVALWALTGNQGILKWRGSVLESIPIHGKTYKVIPSLHPAACLRTTEWTYLLHFDVKSRLVPHSSSPKVPEDLNTYILKPSFDEMEEFLMRCKEAKRVAVDIEVARREVSCISFAHEKGTAISIPFWSLREGHLMTSDQELIIWKRIASILEDEKIEIIYHNAAFDATFLYNKYGIVSKSIHDTMVAQAILFPDFSKSLAFATSLYTDMAYYKDEGKEAMLKTGRIDATDDEIFWRYNARDSLVLLEILEGQLRDLDRANMRAVYNRQRKCLPPIIYMSSIGMRIDTSSLDQQRDKGSSEVEDLLSEIRSAVGYEINPDSPKQLKDYFYEVVGEKPARSKGRVSTDETALKIIARRQGPGAPVASLMLKYRKAKKLTSVYYGMLFDEDNRLRSSINPVGTETGRFSSSKTIFGTGGNMQNMPKSFRRYILPDPGYVMFEVDLSQAENRLVALLANEETMLRAFSEGQDVHSLTASLLFGGPPTKEYQESVKPPIGNGKKTQRAWGKETNHALNYGMGAGTAASRWEIPVGQAGKLRQQYYAAYPNVTRWHRKNEQDIRRTSSVTNLYGRTRRFLSTRSSQIVNQAHAFVPQSTVADHINLYGVQELYYRKRYEGVQLLLQLHDAVYFQVPLSYGWERISEILRDLQNALETPITYEERSIVLPASVTMHPVNMMAGPEFYHHDAETLANLHKRWSMTYYTEREGGPWLPLNIHGYEVREWFVIQALNSLGYNSNESEGTVHLVDYDLNITAHSFHFTDGREWDAINGWR